MKKILLLLFVLLFMQQVQANVIQGSYRWNNDDDNEATVTPGAAENAGLTLASTAGNLRLRFSLYNDDEVNEANKVVQLWYNDGTTDRQITTASTGAFVLAQSGTTLADGQATTQQLGGTLPFVPGKVVTSSSNMSIIIPPASRTEYEWVIRPGTGIQKGKTYTFKVYYDYGIEIDRTGPANTLTTSATLPLKLLSFTARLADKRVNLVWSTAEEENVSHFDIEKSTDGSRFTTIGKVMATSGTGTKTYAYTDMGALAAGNFYRLKMVDKDGKFSYSNISLVKTNTSKGSLSVYPNPAKDRLNISLTADLGEVKLKLLDAGGRVIKTFTIQSEGTEINRVADISSLQRGLYFISFNNQTVRFVKE